MRIFSVSLASAHIWPFSSFPDSVEDELELSAVRHRPEGLEQLEAQTRFSRKELQILYRGFKNVREDCSCMLKFPQLQLTPSPSLLMGVK